ncbi:MAG: prepilin-type N-terminal cleavage/methylation domain-containing protein [Patescibacteria group bacterium]
MSYLKTKNYNGFTLIELLVAISIIGVLIGLSLIGLSGARESARDARRKTDIESIRSGLEMYKADCNNYPASPLSTSLIGDGTPSACAVANIYISSVPKDPADPTRTYFYSTTGTTHILCAALEQAPVPAMGITGCGSCGASVACNYKATNP